MVVEKKWVINTVPSVPIYFISIGNLEPIVTQVEHYRFCILQNMNINWWIFSWLSQSILYY